MLSNKTIKEIAIRGIPQEVARKLVVFCEKNFDKYLLVPSIEENFSGISLYQVDSSRSFNGWMLEFNTLDVLRDIGR